MVTCVKEYFKAMGIRNSVLHDEYYFEHNYGEATGMMAEFQSVVDINVSAFTDLREYAETLRTWPFNVSRLENLNVGVYYCVWIVACLAFSWSVRVCRQVLATSSFVVPRLPSSISNIELIEPEISSTVNKDNV